MPTVSLKDGKTYDAEEDEVVYNALEKQGITLPHGCLSGACGACQIHVISGIENLAPAGAIESNTIGSIHKSLVSKGIDVEKDKIRLSCRAKIKGDITITPL